MITDQKQPNKNKTNEPFRFKKRHGSTIFHVAVYSNMNAKETAQDKIARLIRNDTALTDFGSINADREKAVSE